MAISQAKKLELITKHGRKFAVKSGGGTPILEGAHYAADGSITVCDRHKLLRIRDAHTFTEPFTSHIVTGAPIDGTYPDTSKLIPTDFKTKITLANGVKEAIDRVKLAIDVAKIARDKRFIAVLTHSENSVTISADYDNPSVIFSAEISADRTGEYTTISFNAEYFLAALNVFKDAGSTQVRIGLNGPVSPILLTDEENGIDVIVLPYRRAA
jgi:DNA polymerase III sliding clamp (beta) subunit (PCNA family)